MKGFVEKRFDRELSDERESVRSENLPRGGSRVRWERQINIAISSAEKTEALLRIR